MASEPFNIKKIPLREKVEILVMDDEFPPFDIVDYCEDEEEKFIKDIEKFCRNSFEYQEWVQYLRKYMDMNKCSFFQNISNIDTFSIKIHLHHSPITLMEMVVIILAKRRFYKENMLIEAVSKEVLYNHYLLNVGIIPLCETVHELVHNQYLFVPNSKVLGFYNNFIANYNPWIPTVIRNKLDHIEEWTKFYNAEENTNVIKPHYIYIDLGDNGIGYNLPKMQDVKQLVENKLSEMRVNGFRNEPKELVTMNPDDLAAYYKERRKI